MRGGTASTSSASIVPIAVSIARSEPLVRITVAPVGRAGSTTHAETSIPRAASSSSMNRPNASSPTTPTNATRSPEPRGPAGEDRRRAADRQPDRSDQPLDLAEDRHRIRVGDHDVRVDLADDEDVDRRPLRVATLRSPGTSRRPGPAAAVSRFGRSCHGRPAASASSTSRRSRAAPVVARNASRSAGASLAASAQTDRPTSTPLAPAWHAVSTCASNVASSTPPDSSTHGDARGRVELRAGLAPAGPVRDRGVVGELGLEDVAADRGHPPRGLDDDPPPRLAGQRLALDQRERQRLHEEREVRRPAGRGRPPRRTAPGASAFDASGW